MPSEANYSNERSSAREGDKELLLMTAKAVNEALEEALEKGERDAGALNKVAQKAAGRLVGGKYRRQPVILPAIALH